MNKSEYLLRPDLGRRLADAAEARLNSVLRGAALQVIVGDGFSVMAVARQAPTMLRHLRQLAATYNHHFGQPFGIRHCRVGVLNLVGDLLAPDIVVLLIGERPGLATAESLSAYMAFCPTEGCTDADRNLILNIRSCGTPPEQAAVRIIDLTQHMIRERRSGVAIKELMQILNLSTVLTCQHQTLLGRYCAPQMCVILRTSFTELAGASNHPISFCIS